MFRVVLSKSVYVCFPVQILVAIETYHCNFRDWESNTEIKASTNKHF